jgi:hypothetical protein
VRASQDSGNVYFLVEVSDTDMSSSDYVSLKLAETGSSAVDALSITMNADGLVTADKAGLQVGTISTARMAEGTLDDDSDQDRGWVIEVAVPREALSISGSCLSLNAVLYDNAAKCEDFLSKPLEDGSTKNWKYVKGL